MVMSVWRLWALVLLLAFAGPTGLAQDAETQAVAAAPAAELEPEVFVSERSLRLDGRTIGYTATAGETFLRDAQGTPTAAIFSIAYVADGGDTARPVTFIWNGGPGSSSVWLHMGAWGPRRVVTPSDASDVGAPPYPIVDNPHSLLDVTDMVFIDPVGTGYSRALGETDAKTFWGVTADAESVADFIRVWLTENGRWNSPKYIAGESYGGTRAAYITETLQGGWNGIALNGVLLISPALDFQTIRYNRGNDLAHIGYFPTFAATAWYHGKVDRARWGGDFQRFIDEARAFAMDRYMPALLRGTSKDETELAEIAAEVAAFIGVGTDWVIKSELRFSNSQFSKELLREQSLSVGRFDSRYTGEDDFALGDQPDNDPSGYGMDVAYTAAVNDVLTRELGVDLDREYVILSADVNRAWAWHDGRPGSTDFPNPTPRLAKGLRENRDLRVLVGSGYYDAATPFFASELSLFRNGVDLDRVIFTYYDAGHMMYLSEADAKKLSDDVRNFIRGG